MATVFGLFDTYDQANDAIISLEDVGFDREDIGLLAQEKILRREEAANTAAAATGGAAIGGITGLIVGIAGFTIPGVGPLLGAGLLANLLATTAAGVGAGAVAGSIVGALTDIEAPEEYRASYEQAIKNGKILVAVDTPAIQMREVEDILAANAAQEIHAYQGEPSRATVL